MFWKAEFACYGKGTVSKDVGLGTFNGSENLPRKKKIDTGQDSASVSSS